MARESNDEKIGFNNSAIIIGHTQNQNLLAQQNDPRDAFSKLKSYYSTLDKLPRFIDDPEFEELSIEKSYVNLQIIEQKNQKEKEEKLPQQALVDVLTIEEDINGNKEAIKIEQIYDKLRDEEQPKKS